MIIKDLEMTNIQYMMKTLKNNGMPVKFLSEILDIERSLTYEILDGEHISSNHNVESKIKTIFHLFKNERPGTLKYYSRFKDRILKNGDTLNEILTSDIIDIIKAQNAIDELRLATEKSMEKDSRMKCDMSPASHLTLELNAVFNI